MSSSPHVMNAAAMPAYEWKALPWRVIEREVFKLQKRIYRASSHGNVKAVHRLQRLLMQSWSAKCLAVRRVTQDNQGKKTAGVDGVSSLTPPQRLKLVSDLSIARKARPVRRVWIPKPRSDEKRPLGIPVMHDRAAQALVKLALEPEWEAKFEPNSYGFRPGRSCHDAKEAIFNYIRYRAKFVLDADIAKCFDRINQEALLAKAGTYPTLRRVLRRWLKAGVMEGERLFPTEEGTPQGGVISPLLANIALHGMETYVAERFPKQKPALVRYADDFVVLHPERNVIEQVQQAVVEWLSGMSLELKPEKTKIVHTLGSCEGSAAGFDFLGFTVRQFHVGKRRSAKNRYGTILGFKTIIKPSKEGCKEHQRKLKELIRREAKAPQAALISDLNPVIRGWANYYRTVVSKAEFNRQDFLLFRKLWSWAKRRHKKGKSRKRIKNLYWHEGWKFQARIGPDTVPLLPHNSVKILRHAKVQGKRSPYDGDWVYWTTRMGHAPDVAPQVARLLRLQRGHCALCGLYFKVGDIIENDHIVPREHGGSNGDSNRQLLHRHCHDRKSIHDKDPTTEQPDAAKVASPVP